MWQAVGLQEGPKAGVAAGLQIILIQVYVRRKSESEGGDQNGWVVLLDQSGLFRVDTFTGLHFLLKDHLVCQAFLVQASGTLESLQWHCLS